MPFLISPGDSIALRLASVGAVRRGVGSTPTVDVRFEELANFNPREGILGRSIGTRTLRLPVTTLSRLHLGAFWWRPKGKVQRRWLDRPGRGNLHNAILQLAPGAISVVAGADIGEPISESPLRDMWFLRVANERKRWAGTAYFTEAFVPCSEIVRRYYAASPALLREVFNGDILLKPVTFRYPAIQYSADKGFHVRKTRDLHERQPWGDLSSVGEVEYAYRQLRNIAWGLIACTQQKERPTIIAVPPFLGTWHITGEIYSEARGNVERIIAYRLR